jgi:hypothetical protein
VKRYIAAAAGLAVLAGLLIAWQVTGFGLGHWLQVHLGIANEPGPYYGFWSGFGSDIAEVGILTTLAAAIGGWYHKHNCHTEGCWRLGLHPMAGGQYVVCRTHHNQIEGYSSRKLPLSHIARHHREHLARLESCSCTPQDQDGDGS